MSSNDEQPAPAAPTPGAVARPGADRPNGMHTLGQRLRAPLPSELMADATQLADIKENPQK
jgi:hypothetical protein